MEQGIALRDDIRKTRIAVERIRWQKVQALAKAVRHKTYRIRNEDIAEAILREYMQHRLTGPKK